MCSGRSAVTLGLVAVLLAADVSAQAPVDRKAQLRAEIDSLNRLVDEAVAEQERRKAEARRRELAALSGVIDTVVVGPFKVVGRTDGVAAIGRIFEEAWAERARIAGSASGRLSDIVFLVEDRAPLRILRELAARPKHHQVYLPAWRSRAASVRFAGDAIGAVLTAELPEDLKVWMGGALIGGRVKPIDAYRELATAPSVAARDCFKGNAARCVDALALTDPGAGWSRWYTPDQLRALALPRAARDPRFADEEVVQRALARVNAHPCFAQRNDAACAELFGPRGPSAPLSGYARASFVDFLIDHGGPDAFARLTADRGPIPDRLSRIANGDLNAAATAWRRAMEAGKPQPVGASMATGIATILWVLVFVALATRSTRWRVR